MTQIGRRQCRLIQTSPSTTCCQMRVSLTYTISRPPPGPCSLSDAGCSSPEQTMVSSPGDTCWSAADDCQRIFGAVRISKYVAQDNMEPITCSRRINHRAIAHYFDTYSPAVSRWVPWSCCMTSHPHSLDQSDPSL